VASFAQASLKKCSRTCTGRSYCRSGPVPESGSLLFLFGPEGQILHFPKLPFPNLIFLCRNVVRIWPRPFLQAAMLLFKTPQWPLLGLGTMQLNFLIDLFIFDRGFKLNLTCCPKNWGSINSKYFPSLYTKIKFYWELILIYWTLKCIGGKGPFKKWKYLYAHIYT